MEVLVLRTFKLADCTVSEALFFVFPRYVHVPLLSFALMTSVKCIAYCF